MNITEMPVVKTLLRKPRLSGVIASVILMIINSPVVHALGSSGGATPVGFGRIFLIFAIVLVVATAANVVERFGQPPVVGQILVGIGLSAAAYFGWGLMRDASSNEILSFLANFGAVILLLSAGMESNVRSLAKVGVYAAAVATIGVVLPFMAGAFVVGPWLFPGAGTNAYLFLGAALVATSVGVSVSIFRSLAITRTRPAQTVLAAAVLDDILGLVLLAVISQVAIQGRVNVTDVVAIVAKATAFLFGSLIIGRALAGPIARGMRRLNDNASTKLVLGVALALFLGYLAETVGMQPIVGAFAAGLLLEGLAFEGYGDSLTVRDLRQLRAESTQSMHAKIDNLIDKHRRGHLGGMVDTLGAVAVPVFFVYTGLQIDFGSLLHPDMYLTALIIAVVAIIGKIAAGLAARGGWRERLLVGIAMVPRGEVGLIFATTAKTLGIFNDSMYSTIVIVILLTTFVTPPLLGRLVPLRKVAN